MTRYLYSKTSDYMKPFFTLKSLAMSHMCVTIINQGSLKLGEFTAILDSGHFTSGINNGEVVASTSKLGSFCSVKEDTGYTCDNQLQNGAAEDKS
jgi:hypothetical protein